MRTHTARRQPIASSLRSQLLLYMVLLIAISLLFMMAFGDYFYTRAIDEQATRYAAQTLEQVQINTTAHVQLLDRIIDYLASDDSVLTFLRLPDFYAPERVAAETAVRQVMRTFAASNENLIGGILIANNNDLYASNEMYRIARYPMMEDAWYQQAALAGGERLLLTKPIGRNIRNYRQYGAGDIVSAVRAVFDPETGELLGVICIDMRLKIIETHISDLTLGKDGFVFIMDDSGEAVYAPANASVYRIRPEWLLAGEASSLHTILGVRHQLLQTHSDLTGWRTVGVFRTGEVQEPVIVLRRYTILIALIAVSLATITALLFSSSFTGPISHLRRLMAEAEQGDLGIRFDVEQHSGEIAQLGTSFNSMMDKIGSLLQLVYIEQQNKREADIKTLQAQIKPHFLYNTLDTMRWMAEEHGAKDVVLLITALTRLFRISLSRGHEIIPLADELSHVECYLYIQKVRYEEKLNYTIDCPEGLSAYRINKLVLQPLVENAIYHGIKQKRGIGHIAVTVREQDDLLRIEIADDGAGMPQAHCDTLNASLSSSSMEYDHGYGIFNVNDRIRLSHGEKYGLSYRINELGGVTVTIRFPKIY